MSDSKLVVYTELSPNKSTRAGHVIDTITIHCMAAPLSIEACGNLFAKSATQASSNYGIGPDGRIALYVHEKERSWATSNGANDRRAVTIEVACEAKDPYKVTAKAYSALIELIADICKRNGIKKLLWKGDKSLIGQVDKQNMTVHRWFKNKACPGDYLYNKHPDIVKKVNAKLKEKTVVTPAKPKTPTFTVGKTYTLQAELKVRKGPGTNYAAKTYKELPAAYKKKDSDKDGALEKGTKITCKATKKVGDTIWIHCEAGWIIAYTGTIQYIK